jgi:ABC-2 type transport system permease protein
MKIKNYKAMIPVMIIMTAMTLVFIYIFGIGFSKGFTPKVAIVDEDHSQISEMIVDKLKSQKAYEFYAGTYDESIIDLKKDNIIGFVYIQEGFEVGLEQGKVNVTFFKEGASAELSTLENTLGSLISEVIGDKFFAKGITSFLVAKGVDITTKEIYDDLVENKETVTTFQSKASFFQKDDWVKYNVIKSTFTGFLLFFSMFTIMFGIGTLVDEKELMVWQRQLVSPLSKMSLITGNLISNFVVSMVQMLFVVLASKLFFNMNWGGSTLALICVLGAYVIAGTAMGLFITGFIKTQQQLAAILPTIIVATSMIGGCMWPVEMMGSKFLRTFAEFLPQRWGMVGLSKVILYNGGMEDVIKPIIILLVIAVVFLLASIIPYRKAV